MAEVMYHINMKKGDVGRYVLLPGDPGRCEAIARAFDTHQFVTSHREYTTYTGTVSGEKVSVTSTGIGCPSTAIAIEELRLLGADTFIRVGTSGALQPEIEVGSLAVINGAIRDEGTSIHYMPIEFPAVANIEVTNALINAANNLNQKTYVGITQSKDSFYGQHEPERMPVSSRLTDRWKAWKMGGTICSEMEAAVLFILGSIYGLRTGGIMIIAGNQEAKNKNQDINWTLDGLISTSIEALRILIENDKKLIK